ncbi:hypothetical protein ACB098_01G315600 [Castanea mollissima]
MGHAVPACSRVTVTLYLEETTGHVKRKIAKQPTGPIIWSTWFNNCFSIGWNLKFFLIASCPTVCTIVHCVQYKLTIYIKLFPTRLDFSYFSFMYILWLLTKCCDNGSFICNLMPYQPMKEMSMKAAEDHE